jgi:hypothetical protein
MKHGFVAPALYFREGERILPKDKLFPPKSIAVISRRSDNVVDDVICNIISVAVADATRRTVDRLEKWECVNARRFGR